jgi:hypothetical protein
MDRLPTSGSIAAGGNIDATNSVPEVLEWYYKSY